MRTGAVVMLALTTVLPTTASPQDDLGGQVSDSASKPKPRTKTVTIPVSGMGCGECADRVKKALETLDGVEAVEVINWLDSARVVYFEEQVTLRCMVDAIKELGYEVGEPKEEI
jgi:copper chaperone CopZ